MEVIEIQQKVPSVITLTIEDESVSPHVPIDLTGLTVFVSVKKLTDYTQDDAAAVISSKITVHTFPLLGKTEWALTPTQTYIPLGRYKCDVLVYNGVLDFVNSDTFYIDIVPVVTKRLI